MANVGGSNSLRVTQHVSDQHQLWKTRSQIALSKHSQSMIKLNQVSGFSAKPRRHIISYYHLWYEWSGLWGLDPEGLRLRIMTMSPGCNHSEKHFEKYKVESPVTQWSWGWLHGFHATAPPHLAGLDWRKQDRTTMVGYPLETNSVNGESNDPLQSWWVTPCCWGCCVAGAGECFNYWDAVRLGSSKTFQRSWKFRSA